MMGTRVDTTYNVHGMPWNINPENMNLLLKRLNGSRMLGGSYTPNAKGSFVQRYCITALRLELKLAARAPKSLPWPRRGKVVLAKLGKTVERRIDVGATLAVNDLHLMINHWNVHEWLFSFDHGFLQGTETVESHVSWFWISLAS